MKLKKMGKLLSLLLSLSVMTVVAACSSDDEVKYVEFDESLQSGLSINLKGGIYTLDVKSNDNWTVSLPEDCDWITLVTESGQGNGKITIAIEDNFTGVTRSAYLTLSHDGEDVDFLIKQDDTLDGVAVNDLAYKQLILNKNLGYGCNLAEFYNDPSTYQLKATTNGVVNISALEEYINQNPMQSGMVVSTPITDVNMEEAITDSVEHKKDSLGVSLDLDIAYGLFKFGVHGSYHSSETMSTSYDAIQVAANYPTFEASIGESDIIATYNKWVKASRPDDDIREALYNPGFVSKLEKLESAVASTSTNRQSNINRACKNILDTYGTGVIVKTRLGGLAAMLLEASKFEIADTMRIDTAYVTVAITSGAFSLDGKVEVSYQKLANSVINDHKFALEFRGGSTEAINRVLSLAKSTVFENDDWHDAVVSWAESISNGTDDKGTGANAEMISATMVPIWEFFDGDAQDALIDYILKKYENTIFVRDFLDAEIVTPAKSDSSGKKSTKGLFYKWN
jgi:hypothetical protein